MAINLIKLDGTSFTDQDLSVYFSKTIGRIFNILRSYEECEKTGDFNPYKTYVKRLSVEFAGMNELFDFVKFISFRATLLGMLDDDLCHTDIRSLVLELCNTFEKLSKELNHG